MQTRSGNVYRYDVARPTLEKKVEQPKVAPVRLNKSGELINLSAHHSTSCKALHEDEINKMLLAFSEKNNISISNSTPKVEKRVAPKVEKKVEVKVEPKVEVKIEPTLNSAREFARVSTFDRRPSGFVTPTRISDELAKFLNVPLGTRLARTQVSKLINGYIRANNLQDANNGRVINTDAKLRKLLNAKPTDEVTYFNLQKFMKPHFTRDQ
jgi:chromatin remodeling complex protein RSC6